MSTYAPCNSITTDYMQFDFPAGVFSVCGFTVNTRQYHLRACVYSLHSCADNGRTRTPPTPRLQGMQGGMDALLSILMRNNVES